MTLSAALLTALVVAQAGSGDLLTQARAALDQGRLEEAGRLTAQVLALEPRHTEALYLNGTILAASGRLAEAEQFLQKTVELQPDAVPAVIGLAEVRSRLGKADLAVQTLERGLTSRPGEPLLLFQLAQLLARRQDFKGALERLRAIPQDRYPAGYFEVLGRTLLSAGDLEAAQSAYQRHLEAHPNSVKTLQTLSAIALKRGNPAQAWDYIAQARKLAPNSAQVVFAFAGVSLENHLVSEAITALRLLLLREPDNPEYLLMLGNSVLESATEFSKAVDYFRRYVELRPEDALGHMMLGYGHYVNREYEQAAAELRRTLEIQPDFLEAEYYLAMIDYHGNRDEAAVQRLTTLLARRPEHDKAHTALGKIFLRQRRFSEAVEHLQRAVALNGGSSDLHFNLSRAFTQLGDREEAERQLALYRDFKAKEEQREEEGRRLRFQELREQP